MHNASYFIEVACSSSQARRALLEGSGQSPQDSPKGPPATEGCNPLQGPIDEAPYLDVAEQDAQRPTPLNHRRQKQLAAWALYMVRSSRSLRASSSAYIKLKKLGGPSSDHALRQAANRDIFGPPVRLSSTAPRTSRSSSRMWSTRPVDSDGRTSPDFSDQATGESYAPS